MKIGFIVSDLSNVRIGGISRVATEVGANLAKLGHEVVAFVLDRKGEKQLTEYRGIQIRYIDSFYSINSDYPVIRFSRRAFKRFCSDAENEHFDLLQSFNLNGIAYSDYIPVFKRLAIPFVMASYETIFMDVKAKGREFLCLPSFKTLLQIVFESYLAVVHEKRYLQRAARIITEDQNTKDALARDMKISQDMITLIPSGVDIAGAVASQPADIDIRKGKKGPVVGYIGRVDPRKGVQYLIEALKTVRHQYPEVVLFLAGGSRHGYDRKVRELIARHGLTESVRVLGRISGDILPYYKLADIIVIPSLSEGIPITLGEAMACRVPVVITKLPGVTPFVRPSDLVNWVDIADTASLATGIIAALEDPEKEDRIQRSFDFIKSYGWQEVAERYAVVYQELIDQLC